MIDEQANGSILTQSDFDTLLENPGDSYINVALEKYGFDWSPSGVYVSPNIDAMGVTSSDRLIIVSHDGELLIYMWTWVYGEIAGTVTYYDPTATISSIDDLCITPDGTIWLASGTDLYRTTDMFATGMTLIASFAYNISFIAGIDSLVCHVAAAYTSEINRFYRIDTDGNTYESNIYWPFEINSFDALRLENDDECIILSGEYIPYSTTAVDDQSVVYEQNERTGTISFLYRGERYSDHYEVFIAETEYSQTIHHSTVFSVPDGIGVCFAQTGYEASANYFSVSSSGIWWENATDMSFTATAAKLYLAIVGDYVYAYMDGVLYYSPTNMRFGTTNELRQLDITSSVISGSINNRVKAGVKLAIEKTDTLNDFIDAERMWVTVSVGYHLSDRDLLIRVFSGIVNQVTEADKDKSIVELLATDILHWLTRNIDVGRVQPAFMGGVDNYTDITGSSSNYGGMKHTYPVMRSWYTPDGILAPTRYTSGEAMANTTYISNAVNVDLRVMAGKTKEGENFGIAIRSVGGAIVTKSVWYPDDNEIKLLYFDGTLDENGNAIATELHSVGHIVADQMYIRHIARYGYHQILESTDAIEWTEVFTFISAAGVTPGSAGVCGYHIGEEFDLPELPTFPWQLPWLPSFPPFEPPNFNAGAIVVGVPSGDEDSFDTNLFMSLNPYGASPVWTDITFNLAGEKVTTLNALGDTVFASTKHHIYHMDLNSPTSWDELFLPSGLLHIQHPQLSPDRSKLLFPVLHISSGLTYAYVINRWGTMTDFTPVGNQRTSPTRFITWWEDNESYLAGHCPDLDVVEDIMWDGDDDNGNGVGIFIYWYADWGGGGGRWQEELVLQADEENAYTFHGIKSFSDGAYEWGTDVYMNSDTINVVNGGADTWSYYEMKFRVSIDINISWAPWGMKFWFTPQMWRWNNVIADGRFVCTANTDVWAPYIENMRADPDGDHWYTSNITTEYDYDPDVEWGLPGEEEYNWNRDIRPLLQNGDNHFEFEATYYIRYRNEPTLMKHLGPGNGSWTFEPLIPEFLIDWTDEAYEGDDPPSAWESGGVDEYVNECVVEEQFTIKPLGQRPDTTNRFMATQRIHKVPPGYDGDFEDLAYALCNSASCSTDENCAEDTFLSHTLSRDKSDDDFFCIGPGAPVHSGPIWLEDPVVRIATEERSGLATTYDHSDDSIMVTIDPLACEYEAREAAATFNVHVDDQGRHVFIRPDGTQWAMNKDRSSLLWSDNGFNTVHSISLPSAIEGKTECYLGFDFRGDDPIVIGKAGVYAYSMITELWYDISGNISMSGAIQDVFGLRPKLVATVSYIAGQWSLPAPL